MTISIGQQAPDFELPDTEGRSWSADGAGAPATAVVFTCNHCPYALAWQERITDVARDYAERGVRVLAINSNDADRYPRDSLKAMRERVERLVGGVSRRMWVTTFHSACARMLRADAERLGYSSRFTIYDEADSLRMLKRCMEELQIDPKRYPARSIRARISDAKNELVGAEELEQRQGSPYEEVVASAYKLYEKRMLEANAMDFDDLLCRTVNALARSGATASAGSWSTSTRTPTAPSTGSFSCSASSGRT